MPTIDEFHKSSYRQNVITPQSVEVSRIGLDEFVHCHDTLLEESTEGSIGGGK
jgi:hypothetical protein